MADIMQRLRAKYNWFYDAMEIQNMLHMYVVVLEGAEERLRQWEEALESYKRNPPLLDRITGKKDLRIAELELEVQEARKEYDQYALPYEQAKQREAEINAAETPETIDELRREAEKDPANKKELAFLNARLCAVSIEIELMELHSDLGTLQGFVEEMVETGAKPDRETIQLYGDILKEAKECIPYVETFAAEMEVLGHPWRMRDFFRNPDAMSPVSPDAIAKAAEEVQETMDSMEKTVEFLSKHPFW